MDEYAEHIYKLNPHYRTVDAGDMTGACDVTLAHCRAMFHLALLQCQVATVLNFELPMKITCLESLKLWFIFYYPRHGSRILWACIVFIG